LVIVVGEDPAFVAFTETKVFPWRRGSGSPTIIMPELARVFRRGPLRSHFATSQIKMAVAIKAA